MKRIQAVSVRRLNFVLSTWRMRGASMRMCTRSDSTALLGNKDTLT